MATQFIPTGYGTIQVITDFGPQGEFTIEEARSQYGYTGTAQDKRTQEAGGPATNPISSRVAAPPPPLSQLPNRQFEESIRRDNLINTAVRAGLLDPDWISKHPDQVAAVVEILGNNPNANFYNTGLFGHPAKIPIPIAVPTPATAKPKTVTHAKSKKTPLLKSRHTLFQYQKLNQYPHMKPADISIWERFIQANPQAYDHVYYDFWVGSPPPFNPIVHDPTQGSADGLYRRKIDVVAYKGNQIDIIELKPKAGPSALGQVRGYLALYMRDERPAVTPRAVVITNIALHDLVYIAAIEGVTLFVV